MVHCTPTLPLLPPAGVKTTPMTSCSQSPARPRLQGARPEAGFVSPAGGSQSPSELGRDPRLPCLGLSIR